VFRGDETVKYYKSDISSATSRTGEQYRNAECNLIIRENLGDVSWTLLRMKSLPFARPTSCSKWFVWSAFFRFVIPRNNSIIATSYDINGATVDVTRDIRGRRSYANRCYIVWWRRSAGWCGWSKFQTPVSTQNLEENFFSQETVEANKCVWSRSSINCEAQECMWVWVCTAYTRVWRGDETQRAV
jgi:hypothetical protein